MHTINSIRYVFYKAKRLQGYRQVIFCNYSTGFPCGQKWLRNFYPRNIRVNIGPPIIPLGVEFNFAAHSALKFGFETAVSHINFGFDPPVTDTD